MRFFGLAAALAAMLSLPAVAQAGTDEPDGTLLSAKPCEPLPYADHDAYFTAVRDRFEWDIEAARKEGIVRKPISDAALRAALPDAATFADYKAYEGFECLDIRYASHGLVIAGYLWKPKDTKGKRLPLIIGNRGGNRDYGPMPAWRFFGWHDFLKAGYVVLASQYREGPGSEGRDEFGGKDVDDIRALVPLAKSLGYVDMDNMFLFGGSRGGMMTFLLARGPNPFRALGVRGAITDLDRGRRDRPLFEKMWSEMMPDWTGDGSAAIERRSAAKWADEITTPAIVFHGSDDWRVDPQDALDVVAGMRKSGVPVELHFYMGDTHGIDLNQRDMIHHTLAFFERFKSRPNGEKAD